MLSVIILAGESGKDRDITKNSIEEYRGVYKEEFLWNDYKALTLVRSSSDNQKRHMVDLVIENVSRSEEIGDIVVIGDQRRLVEALGNKVYGKPVIYVEQVGTLLENALEGYDSSISGKNDAPALFLPADIPLTQTRDYDEFIDKSKLIMDFYGMLYAIVDNDNGARNRRDYLGCIDDLFLKDEKIRGFRIANMLIAKPSDINNLKKINNLYSSRKLKYWRNILKFVSSNPILPYYFLKYKSSKLRLTDINNAFSKLLGTRFSLIRLSNPLTEADIDSVEDLEELNGINT